MARKKRVYTDSPEDILYFQKRLIINRLRQVSRYWPAKKIALDKAKHQIQIGFYKNGEPKYKIKYKCAHCGKFFNIDEVDVDHIESVVSTEDGFRGFGDYIDRLFCGSSNLQILCSDNCHQEKTQKELKIRKKKR